MKRFLLLGVLISTLLLSGCGEKEDIRSFHLEPKEYVIVNIDTGKFIGGSYGYIKEEDVEKYLNGKLKGQLKVLHPYEKGKFVIVNINDIEGLEVGTYRDLR